jgi:hypothetical protein
MVSGVVLGLLSFQFKGCHPSLQRKHDRNLAQVLILLLVVVIITCFLSTLKCIVSKSVDRDIHNKTLQDAFLFFSSFFFFHFFFFEKKNKRKKKQMKKSWLYGVMLHTIIVFLFCPFKIDVAFKIIIKFMTDRYWILIK